MNGSMWVPFFVVASAEKSRRKRLVDAMLPAMIPVAPAVQVAVAAVAADIQVRREDRQVATVQAQEAAKQEALLTESVAAAAKLVENPAGKKLTLAELDAFPSLKAALEARPQLFDRIAVRAAPAGGAADGAAGDAAGGNQ